MTATIEIIDFVSSVYMETLSTVHNKGKLRIHKVCKKGLTLEVVQLLLNKYPEGVTQKG